jgi:hypothetical protein
VLVMVPSHSRFIMAFERANQFLETSFLPGRVFTSPEDVDAQLAMWLPKANAPLVSRTCCAAGRVYRAAAVPSNG